MAMTKYERSRRAATRRTMKAVKEMQAAKRVKEAAKAPQVETVWADWKDIEGLAQSFKDALKAFGLHMVDDPMCAGQDCFGYLISRAPLTDAQVRKCVTDRCPEFYEMQEEG